jgi:hypothetical protein
MWKLIARLVLAKKLWDWYQHRKAVRNSPGID